MKLTPVPERTLEQAKMDKKFEIERYDNSESVNSFTINKTISAWFTPAERANYKNSIEASEIMEFSTVQLYVGS